MTSKLMTGLALFGICFFFALSAHAQSGSANTARENARSAAETQARAEIESLLARLCPGRCELVELRATVSQPRAAGEVAPGFEGAPGTRFEVEVRRLEATILMDSSLPENFRTNIPRMAQYRLQDIANVVEVRPEFLEFPQPQLPPMPTPLPHVAPEPPRQPQPLPRPEPEPIRAETPEEPPAEVEPLRAEPPLWQELLPWIALLLTLLILGGLIILILRRLEAISSKPDAAPAAADTEGDEKVRPKSMPDIDALRDELKRSRSVLNRMLRRWIEDSPEEVAVLIRLLGPEILSDLRRDSELRPSLEVVSDHVAGLDEAVDAERAHGICEKARSRHAAQLVVDDSSGDMDWGFLEGLSLGQVGTLLNSASQQERGFILSRLSPVIRSRHLENLSTAERRQLLLEASSAQTLSKSQARELAQRMRQIADEFIDAGREAEGQAALIVEMIEAMSLGEQEDVLRDLQSSRPDVAHAVLARICLESTLLQLPEDSLTNAVHRLPVEKITTFLQGTRRDIADHILSCSPGSKRQALATELSLDIPTARADFLDARQAFSTTVLATLRRDGYEVAKFNANALRRGAHGRTAQPEVAE